MSSPGDNDAPIMRQRRTLILLAFGALSLLIPLLGVIYLRLSDSSKSGADLKGAVFTSRNADGSARERIVPTLVPAAPLPRPGTDQPAALSAQAPAALPAAPLPASSQPRAADPGSSLSFIRGGEDYYNDAQPQQAPQPAPQGQQPQAAGAPVATPPAQTAAAKAPPAKKALKPVVMPKLKPTSGFSDFRSGQLGGGGAGAGPDQGYPPGGGAPPDMSALMQGGGIPPGAAPPGAGAAQAGTFGGIAKPASGAGSGANLSGLGKPAAAGSQGMPNMPQAPDMSGVMKGMNGMLQGAGDMIKKTPPPPGTNVPDVSNMLKNIPGLPPSSQSQ